MDRKDRDEEYDDHWRGSEGHEGGKENQQSADNLDGDRRPAQQVCEGHAQGVENRNERVRTSIKLCIAMFDEAETDDEPERQGVPGCRDWKGAVTRTIARIGLAGKM